MDPNPIDPTPRPWRSLEERAGLPGEPEEFPAGASEAPAGLGRRRFLQLLGASAALAATVACDRKGVPLVPYTRRPTEGVPGVTNFYASAFPEAGKAHPVLVRTREGRPVHVSGHDLGGKAPLRATADLLGLYDPDRLRGPLADGKPISWDQALERLARGFSNGRPVLLVTGASASPTRECLLRDLGEAVPGLEWLSCEGLPGAPVDLRGWKPRLEPVKVLLSLGSDFLAGDDPSLVEAYARRREPGEGMLRLWAAEGSMSLTGANADHRILLKPSQVAAFASALAQALKAGQGVHPAPSDLESGVWGALVEDLRSAGPRALVLCGPALPEAAHRAVHALNRQMGSLGLAFEPEGVASGLRASQVLPRLESGHYGAVLFWGCNPLYTSPEAGRWRSALARVPFRCWMGLQQDETSTACSLLLPEHHWLEAWGDHALSGGRLALQQPVVGALHDSRQGEDVLLALLRTRGKSACSGYFDYLKERWRREVQPPGSAVPFERYFASALHEGLVKARVLIPPIPAAVRESTPVPEYGADAFELLLAPDRRIFDGRYGNNGWLQELPEPVSKTAWGNPLMISPADAHRLSLADGDMVRLDAGPEHLELPVCIQPGQAPGVLSLTLGYGRSHGRVAKGVGVNAFPLLDPAGSGLRTGVALRRLGARMELPRTQGHHRMEGRDILRIQEGGHAHSSHAPHELPSLYPPQVFGEQRWGMVVDLNRCVGCSTCVLACQSENNIPVVGPEQVARGREMHWLRIDRYYEGDPANPRAAHQPMMCQHCDHAPCENVCPVNATNHSPDGLNQMVYNRCVGTRYCANNCPYKVRRFNFLEYNYARKEPELLAHNPEVTVRPRGVMEKCTFCIQRIQDARVRAKLEKRPLKDGDITPACVAACPAGAIVFGDLKDPHSRVVHLAEDPRGYKVLEELGVRPAITYLAALRNPLRGGKS
ncbi:TAT-variant-translocated molybdopterin oxidoreductase [Holophaga foetida]|uniref:TAT-variant-translocated molybdopterin oxidoreductase n=1 Tax=Holophaga foetida TaxID=35839 RepID=UPI0002472EF4|nr:TAT-variant-translocated molybdopterin oxidoreductase [Holophaga foetida]